MQLTPDYIMEIADRYFAYRDSPPTIRGRENIVAFAQEIENYALLNEEDDPRVKRLFELLNVDDQTDDTSGVPFAIP